MKIVGRRSMVMYILLFAFIAGVISLYISVFANAEKWVAQDYNGHMYADDGDARLSDIVDRNGVLLSYSEDGYRYYSEDETIRTALLHTIGDSDGYIGTSVLEVMGAKLMGYNILTGLNPIYEDGLFLDNSNELNLTVDAKLSAMAYDLIKDKNASILISNYLTGEIICKVSTPSYDPMNVPEDLEENDIYNGAYFDNTLSTTYTPGSTFKVVTAASAIENIENIDEVKFHCNGECSIGGGIVSCMSKHGEIDLSQAIAFSCNVYFAELANMLGHEALQETADSLGFNQSFNNDGFYNTASYFDVTNASDYELAWAGVGQYSTKTNPTHMLMLMQAIANYGVSKELKLTNELDFTGSEEYTLMDRTTAIKLKSYMRENMRNYAKTVAFPEMEIAAKTGTAEVDGEKDTSWIVGFCGDESTPYAFTVVVRDSGFGMAVSGNIAATLLWELYEE